MLWLLRTQIQQNEPINEYSDSFTEMKNNEIYMLWKITIPIDFQINLSIWKPIIWMFLVYALWAHMVVMREKTCVLLIYYHLSLQIPYTDIITGTVK